METVLGLLGRYQYAAMFTVLLLCGVGLPLPEEVTLLASGLAVGWGDANFWLASAVCVAGILAGDSIIFGLGRKFGKTFFLWRPVRMVLPFRRQKRVTRFFAAHGNKTVFLARFFAGIRIGVYAYAGQHGMPWSRFLLYDFLGAIISGPTSIWVGKFAASKIADPLQAKHIAFDMFHKGQHWLYAVVGALVILMILHALWNRARDRAQAKANGVAIHPVIPPNNLESDSLPSWGSAQTGGDDPVQQKLPPDAMANKPRARVLPLN